MKDPTFQAACRMQMREFREGQGCNICVHRDREKRAFGFHICGAGHAPHVGKAYCWRWKYDEKT